MISLYSNTVSNFNELLDVVSEVKDMDFYITENNQRVVVNSADSLKKLIKESHIIYFVNDFDSGAKGILSIWKSVSPDMTRNYIKVLANDGGTLRDLLTVLSWSYGEEVYIKLQRDSNYLKSFYSKGFRFNGGRGNQVLLKRDKKLILPPANINSKDKEDNNVNKYYN